MLLRASRKRPLSHRRAPRDCSQPKPAAPSPGAPLPWPPPPAAPAQHCPLAAATCRHTQGRAVSSATRVTGRGSTRPGSPMFLADRLQGGGEGAAVGGVGGTIHGMAIPYLNPNQLPCGQAQKGNDTQLALTVHGTDGCHPTAWDAAAWAANCSSPELNGQLRMAASRRNAARHMPPSAPLAAAGGGLPSRGLGVQQQAKQVSFLQRGAALLVQLPVHREGRGAGKQKATVGRVLRVSRADECRDSRADALAAPVQRLPCHVQAPAHHQLSPIWLVVEGENSSTTAVSSSSPARRPPRCQPGWPAAQEWAAASRGFRPSTLHATAGAASQHGASWHCAHATAAAAAASHGPAHGCPAATHRSTSQCQHRLHARAGGAQLNWLPSHRPHATHAINLLHPLAKAR